MLCRNISGFDGIPCTNISDFEGIYVTVGIFSQRCRRNKFHRDTSRDDCKNPLLRDAGRKDRRNSFLRDISRDNCRNPFLRYASRDDHIEITVEMPLSR